MAGVNGGELDPNSFFGGGGDQLSLSPVSFLWISHFPQREILPFLSWRL